MANENGRVFFLVLFCALATYHTGFAAVIDRKLFTTTGVTEKDVVDKWATDEFETALSLDDFVAAEKLTEEVDLASLGIAVKPDPLLGDYAEGDIAIKDLKKFVADSNQLARNAIRSTWRHWPDGEIPYTMSSRYGSYSRTVIARAMTQYQTKTCVRFVPRDASKHADYVYIVPDDGCYSLVGRTGGRQPLSLDAGCIQTGG